MATGILSSTTLAATTYTSVYSPTVAHFGVVTLNVCNKNATAIEVRVAVATDPAIPAAGDYIEYGTEILANGVLERTGIVIEAGRSIYVYSTQANTDAVVMGIETSTA
tara:strand:+ start:217 stop:540 length:324 start_codon:yes stop_codon:yes gene_type:complete